MKKLLNFRLIFLCAIFIICTILCCVFLFKTSLSKLYLLFLLLILLVVVAGIALIFKARALKILVAVVAVTILPVGLLYSSQTHSDKLARFEGKPVAVMGRIADIKHVNNNYVRLTLDGVQIDDDYSTTSLNEKIFIRISAYGFDESEAKLGRMVVAQTKLQVYSVEKMDSYVGGYLANGIYGIGYCYYYNVVFSDEMHPNLRDIVKTKFKQHLDSLNFEYSEIGYSMLFGDTDDLDGDVLSAFQDSGVAHILAVSGLHVSIILLMLNFILKKLKTSNVLRLIFSAILLSFYAYLCNFTVSVMRASLMAIILLYAKCRGKSYDSLNALSFVACLFLTFNPLNLFSVAFILSFTSVFAIIVLSRTIDKALSKHMNRKVASLLALNLAVQLIIFADSVIFFKDYHILSLLANLITVPIVSIMLLYFILVSLITLIFPFLRFLTYPYSWLATFVVNFNYTLSSLHFNLSLGGTSGILILFMLLFIFACSEYLFLKKKQKLPVALVLLLLMTVICIL